jgi:hypothetical protein
MWKMRNAYRMFVEILEESHLSENLRVDGRILLKWIFRQQGWKMWTELIWLEIGMVGMLL